MDVNIEQKIKEIINGQNRQNQNRTVNNILNLSLDYLSWDGRQTTLNFDPGQYQICFIASNANALIRARPFGDVSRPRRTIVSNVLFDLSDFSENEIKFTLQNILCTTLHFVPHIYRIIYMRRWAHEVPRNLITCFN